ncbi:hypothetical protein HDV62DRAFT_372254 [Trichoderma sp. SZMC 28011]
MPNIQTPADESTSAMLFRYGFVGTRLLPFHPPILKQGGCIGGGEVQQKAKIWIVGNASRKGFTHLACLPAHTFSFFLFSSFACFFNHSSHPPRPVEEKSKAKRISAKSPFYKASRLS